VLLEIYSLLRIPTVPDLELRRCLELPAQQREGRFPIVVHYDALRLVHQPQVLLVHLEGMKLDEKTS
jgi:hypothetical protein